MLLAQGLPERYIRQEVPVKELIPDYPNGRDRYDYYLPLYNCVVELHGQQHAKPVDFGGEGSDKARRNLVDRINKDIDKYMAALDAGIACVTIWHDEEIAWELFENKLKEEMEHLPIQKEEETKEKTFVSSKQKMQSTSEFQKTNHRMGQQW